MPQIHNKRGPRKGNAPLTHISILPKERKKAVSVSKTKSEDTVALSSSEFLGEIETYLFSLTRAGCCVTVQGEARSLAFFANKPLVVNHVALSMQMYFDFDNRNQRYHLAEKVYECETKVRRLARPNMQRSLCSLWVYFLSLALFKIPRSCKSHRDHDTWFLSATDVLIAVTP